MKTRLAVLAGSLLLALAASPAVDAQTIHQRIANLEKRIDHGVRSKELTRAEADRLREELREIKKREHRLHGDGKLGPREREALNTDLERLSRKIAREKHDDQKRR